MTKSMTKNERIIAELNGATSHHVAWYSAVIFGLFLLGALGIYFSGINHSLFLAINHQHALLPDNVWSFFNLLSYSKFFILPVLLLVITFCWRREKFANVILLVIAYYVVFAALKTAVGEARPYITLPLDSFYWLNHFENAVKSAHKSFPSGHTGNMAVFAFAISSLFFSRKMGLQFLMLLLVVVTALARICTGWHWPLDVLASGMIAYLLVKICLAINLTLFSPQRR